MRIPYSISLAAIFPVLMFSMGGLAQAQEENATTASTFLAVQHSQSGSISELNATSYVLELNDVTDKTILFSERPDRIVTSASTSDFIGNWTTELDSFAADAPNAALVLEDEQQMEAIAIIELSNPVYDRTSNTLTYDIIPVNATSIDIPNEFGQPTLVIDNWIFPDLRHHQ